MAKTTTGPISVIPTTSGSYNVIGVANGMFILQGNLTLAQLKVLQREIATAIKGA